MKWLIGLGVAASVALMTLVVLGLLTIAGQVNGCHQPVSASELPGRYVGEYGFATSTLILKADGSLFQEVKVKADGKTVTSLGTWHLDDDQYIVLDPFMEVGLYGNMIPDFDDPKKVGKALWPVCRTPLRGVFLGGEPAVPHYRK